MKFIATLAVGAARYDRPSVRATRLCRAVRHDRGAAAIDAARAVARCALPAAARRRPGIGAGAAAAPARHAASSAVGGADPDHPGDRRRGRHDHRRDEPGARVRHRRRGRPGSLPRQDRRSEGRRRDVVDARDRTGVWGWHLDAGGVHDRVRGGVVVVRRIVRERARRLRSEDRSERSGRAPSGGRGTARQEPPRVLDADDLQRGSDLRGPAPDRQEDRSDVERDPQDRPGERDRGGMEEEREEEEVGSRKSSGSCRTAGRRRNRARAGRGWLPAGRPSTPTRRGPGRPESPPAPFSASCP